MSNMMHVILYAIVPIIVVMLAGYISGKRGAFTGEDAKKFNKVVLVYALPAALFVSIVQASREMLARDIKLTLISLVGIMLCFMIVYWVFKYCFKKNTGADAAVSALISGSPTIGFLGFAVLEPIFGTNPSVALVVAIVGIVVNAVGIPVGLSLMNASLEKENPGSAKKEAGASCVGAASGVGTDSCSGLGSGWYSMAGLGESVIRPYQGRECVDGCFFRRYNFVGNQDSDQLAGSARFNTQDGSDAGCHSDNGSCFQDGSSESQDARCSSGIATGILGNHHSR